MQRPKLEIRYVTTWYIDAPLEAVCYAICKLRNWPQWWPSVKSVVEVSAAELPEIEGVYHFIWKGVLPYRLEFDMKISKFIPFQCIEGQVTGDVKGKGTWYFSVQNEITVARYEWHVSICNPMIRFLAFLVYPLVRWNHHDVMRQGGLSLAHLLNAKLLKIEHN